MLSVNPWHYLDDSNHRLGRYDIYAADVWLFTQPLAPRLTAEDYAELDRINADQREPVSE